MQNTQLNMTPPTMTGVYMFAPMILFLFILSGAFVYFMFSGRSVTVDDTTVTVSGTFYGDEIARSNLVVEKAKVVELKGEYLPTLRTNGYELFGYQEGWFELANGEKALLVVSGDKPTVYLPTSDGWAAIVSAADPDALLKAVTAR